MDNLGKDIRAVAGGVVGVGDSAEVYAVEKNKRPTWDAYSSYKNLCQEPDQVLSQIGSLYRITFA